MPTAEACRATVGTERLGSCPCSARLTCDFDLPIRSPTDCWVMPAAIRASRSSGADALEEPVRLDCCLVEWARPVRRNRGMVAIPAYCWLTSKRSAVRDPSFGLANSHGNGKDAIAGAQLRSAHPTGSESGGPARWSRFLPRPLGHFGNVGEVRRPSSPLVPPGATRRRRGTGQVAVEGRRWAASEADGGAATAAWSARKRSRSLGVSGGAKWKPWP